MTYSKKELKNYLKDISQGKRDASSFSFEYQAGHREFHSRLRINLSIDKIIQWKIPKKTPLDDNEEMKVAKKRETEFSKEKMSAFIEEIIDSKIWELENCTDRALPDTPLLKFKIREGDQLIFEQDAWETCKNDSDRVKKIIRSLEAILPAKWPPP